MFVARGKNAWLGQSRVEEFMKKFNIFNSLGSNYTWQDALVALGGFFSPEKSAPSQLAKKLQQLFPDYFVTPTYKGRDALEIALRTLGVGVGEVVLTQAFSCFAVEEAIVRCGAKPLYYDLEPNSLIPSQATLDQALQRFIDKGNKTQQIKAIIAQYTLGNIQAADVIERWAKHHGIAYVADLAQAFGVKRGEATIGNCAQAIVISTGRDKVWDAMSGGFALTQTPVTQNNLPDHEVSTTQTLQDCSYPILSLLIRWLYPIQLGKILHKIVTLSGVFYSPIESKYRHMTKMSPALASFLLHRWSNINLDLAHRRKIAQTYHEALAGISLVDEAGIQTGANLRFPIRVADPHVSIQQLQNQGFYLSDRWYRQPVDKGNFHYHTNYEVGSCPNAEEVAKYCLNLPTHRLITPQLAKTIAQSIL